MALMDWRLVASLSLALAICIYTARVIIAPFSSDPVLDPATHAWLHSVFFPEHPASGAGSSISIGNGDVAAPPTSLAGQDHAAAAPPTSLAGKDHALGSARRSTLFPDVPQFTPAQSAAQQALRRAATSASAAATPALLKALDSPEARTALAACCSRSGVHTWDAGRLLETVRSHVAASEVMHNFDGLSGASLVSDSLISMLNRTTANPRIFPSLWQNRWVGFNSASMATYLHPHLHEDAAEQSLYRLPPFSGKSKAFNASSWEARNFLVDVRGGQPQPASWQEASSRLVYGACNVYRHDAGLSWFGDAAIVISPALAQTAAALVPMDSGEYITRCNRSYYSLRGAHRPIGNAQRIDRCPDEARGEMVPGVAGSLDHVVLAHLALHPAKPTAGGGAHDGVEPRPPGSLAALRERPGALRLLFSRWGYADNAGEAAVLPPMLGPSMLEAGVLANLRYEDNAIKMFVASFPALFGSARGETLRAWAAEKGIALVWALGAGVPLAGLSGRLFLEREGHREDHQDVDLVRAAVLKRRAADRRLLDLSAWRAVRYGPRVLSGLAAVDDAAVAGFEALWHEVMRIRARTYNYGPGYGGIYAPDEYGLPPKAFNPKIPSSATAQNTTTPEAEEAAQAQEEESFFAKIPVALWQRAMALSPALVLRLPEPGSCADDWERCLGQNDAGECVCYEGPSSTVVGSASPADAVPEAEARPRRWKGAAQPEAVQPVALPHLLRLRELM